MTRPFTRGVFEGRVKDPPYHKKSARPPRDFRRAMRCHPEPMNTSTTDHRFRPGSARLLACLLLPLFASLGLGAESKKSFDVPAGSAAATRKQFSAEASSPR